MQTMGKQHGNMSKEFARGIQTTGLISMGREMSLVTGLSTSMTTGIVGLITTIKAAMASAGGLAIALSIAAAAIGGIMAAVAAFNKKAADMAKAMEETRKKSLDMETAFTAAKDANVDLGFSLLMLSAHNKGLTRELNAQRAELLKLQLAEEEAEEQRIRAKESVAMLKGGFDFGSESMKKWRKELAEQSVKVAETRANMEAAGAGFATWKEHVVGITKDTIALTKAQEGLSKELAKSSAELAVAMDPSKTFDVELAAIKRNLKARLDAIDKIKTGEQEKNDMMIKANAIAANESALAWEREAKRIAATQKEAAKQTQQAWSQTGQSMQSIISTVMGQLVKDTREGTVKASKLFEALGDAVANTVMSLMQQQGRGGGGVGGGLGGGGGLTGTVLSLVSTVFSSVMGGGGTQRFQHGGRVPAPRGQPRMAIVHGGEDIVTPTGRGAGVGVGGGGATYNITYKQGILTPESARAVIRTVSRSQRGAGERTFPVRR